MKLLYWTGWLLSRMIGRLIFRMKIFEANNIPDKGPFILACNHISLVDPPLVGSTIVRPLHFMAKKELFRSRLFGWVIRNTNAHPINRRGFDRRAINTACEILKAGCGLLVFPEGTRALKGDFLPPRPGIGLIAIRSEAPVVPAYFNGSNNLKAVFW
jgi:1-acyl-sn-glycerol-3-phosphate acyltransferase